IAGLAPVILGSGGLSPGEFYLALLIANTAGVFLTAAILRKAVRDEFLGPIGLAFGQDEARLLGVLGSTVLLLLPVAIVGAIIYTIVLIGSMHLTPEQMEAMSQDPVAMQKAIEDTQNSSAGGTLQILAILGGVLLFVIIARLWMINAAT